MPDDGSGAKPEQSFTYQWNRCNAAGANCFPVTGQTGANYGLSADDVGSTITLVVTATNSDGSKAANSKPSAVISADVIPAASKAPAITGTAEVGSALTTTTGTWSSGPTITVRWQRCNSAGKSCIDVAGATARNDLGAVDSVSAATAVVAPLNGTVPGGGVKLPSGELSVDAGTVALPQRLVLSNVTLAPLTIASRTSKVTVKLRVTDTRGYAVSNALVSVSVLPPDRATTGAAQRTAADGWATFTLTPSAGLPLRRGAVVYLFARATKDGDSPLAGVSAARLVQLKVKPA